MVLSLDRIRLLHKHAACSRFSIVSKTEIGELLVDDLPNTRLSWFDTAVLVRESGASVRQFPCSSQGTHRASSLIDTLHDVATDAYHAPFASRGTDSCNAPPNTFRQQVKLRTRGPSAHAAILQQTQNLHASVVYASVLIQYESAGANRGRSCRPRSLTCSPTEPSVAPRVRHHNKNRPLVDEQICDNGSSEKKREA
jgi:hypothetical protein